MQSETIDVVLENETEDGRPLWATRRFLNKENVFGAVSHGDPTSLLQMIIPVKGIEVKDQTEGLKRYFLSAMAKTFMLKYGMNRQKLTCLAGSGMKTCH